MMKKIVGMFVFSISIVFVLSGCTSNITPTLQGAYQNENVDGYIVQMAFQLEEKSFVEYIDNREVDKGSYEKLENDVYKIYGELQEFEIKLNSDNTFDIIVKKLNNGKPFKMKNFDITPVYIGTEFDDVEEFKALLK
ncbi:hypothetical protein V7138_07310 [Bacillus sp. JJ1533]|uniref:hypothetical protein n=1 Tax=Bacillus sp. JJ1533 TaxID=3122959 RepID=UPI003000ECB1